VRFRRQLPVGVQYKGFDLKAPVRLDLLVEDQLVVELKAVDHMTPVHRAQLLTYLRLSHIRLGLLINFNVESLRDGIRRVVNG
jgi:GxxExxY protein